MRGTGILAQVLGAISAVIGVILLLSSFGAGQSRLQAAITEAQGARAIGAGVALVLMGTLLRGLADLLDEMRGLRSDLARRAATESHEPARHPVASGAPAPRQLSGVSALPPKESLRWDTTPLPARIELVGRHGEEIGGRAWEIIRRARKSGFAIPEADAVAKAREERAGQQPGA